MLGLPVCPARCPGWRSQGLSARGMPGSVPARCARAGDAVGCPSRPVPTALPHQPFLMADFKTGFAHECSNPPHAVGLPVFHTSFILFYLPAPRLSPCFIDVKLAGAAAGPSRRFGGAGAAAVRQPPHLCVLTTFQSGIVGLRLLQEQLVNGELQNTSRFDESAGSSLCCRTWLLAAVQFTVIDTHSPGFH